LNLRSSADLEKQAQRLAVASNGAIGFRLGAQTKMAKEQAQRFKSLMPQASSTEENGQRSKLIEGPAVANDRLAAQETFQMGDLSQTKGRINSVSHPDSRRSTGAAHKYGMSVQEQDKYILLQSRRHRRNNQPGGQTRDHAIAYVRVAVQETSQKSNPSQVAESPIPRKPKFAAHKHGMSVQK